MFGLFGSKDKKKQEERPKRREPLTSEQIREQAMANARAARESIGQETLDKIAEALQKKQNSKAEQAKARIAEKSPREVAEEILAMRRGEYD